MYIFLEDNCNCFRLHSWIICYDMNIIGVNHNNEMIVGNLVLLSIQIVTTVGLPRMVGAVKVK